MSIRRRRVKQELSLAARLKKHAEATRESARKFPPGRQREMLLRQARASEIAAQIDKWIASPGLRPPE
jgi:hypothetical protein